jgi:hypothetical protein
MVGFGAGVADGNLGDLELVEVEPADAKDFWTALSVDEPAAEALVLKLANAFDPEAGFWLEGTVEAAQA